MSTKDKQDRKSAPLPWTVGDDLHDFAAMDADGWHVFVVASRFYDGEPRGEDARRLVERIVLAVNEHDKMHRIAVELAKSRDAAWRRAQKLDGLLKRALVFVNECFLWWKDKFDSLGGDDGTPYTCGLKSGIDECEAIMRDARNMIGEEI